MPASNNVSNVGSNDGSPQDTARELIPVERLKMSHVKNQPVPGRDRAFVQGLARNEFEQRIGMGARAPQLSFAIHCFATRHVLLKTIR